MILNPIICEDCKKELQPENLRVGFDNDNLIRICGFCGHEVKVDANCTKDEVER